MDHLDRTGKARESPGAESRIDEVGAARIHALKGGRIRAELVAAAPNFARGNDECRERESASNRAPESALPDNRLFSRSRRLLVHHRLRFCASAKPGLSDFFFLFC